MPNKWATIKKGDIVTFTDYGIEHLHLSTREEALRALGPNIVTGVTDDLVDDAPGYQDIKVKRFNNYLIDSDCVRLIREEELALLLQAQALLRKAAQVAIH